MKCCTFLVILLAAFIYIHAESQVVDKETLSVFDLIKHGADSLVSLENTNNELRDRLKLLSYVLNTTISYQIYEIAVELRDLQFDADDLKNIHDRIFDAKDNMNFNISTLLKFCNDMSAVIRKLHTDVTENLIDLVEDFSKLVTILSKLDEVYWATFPSIGGSMEKIMGIVLEAILEEQEGSEDADITKLLVKIDALIGGEKIGIELCKYDLDTKIISAQQSIKEIIDRLSVDDY